MKKILLLLLIVPFLMGASPSRSYTYSSGTTIDPDEVTTNEDNIYLYLSGGVDTYKANSITGSALSSTLAISSSGNMTFSGTTNLTGTFQIDGSEVTASAANLNSLSGVTASAAELNILDGANLSTAELNYVDGVSSAIQTQLDGKSATTGNSSIVTVGTVATGNWAATDVPVTAGGTGGSTAAAARGNLSAAALGANSDITSLSALSTPLSIAQGGTGTNATKHTTLTTNTSGNYANGDGEAGNALTGDSATSFFSSGTLATGIGGTGATAAANAANGVVVLDANSKLSGKMFGAWVNKSSSYSAQQAATDGFVVAQITWTAGNDISQNIIGYTDANANPTTAMGSATAAERAGYTSNRNNSFTMPVKKGDYWKVVVTNIKGAGTYTKTVYWIPLGS